MWVEKFPPKDIVLTGGFYYCLLCKFVVDLARETQVEPLVVATACAQKRGIAPNLIAEVFEESSEPIVRKRFRAIDDRFGECPIHQAETKWVLEKEGKIWTPRPAIKPPPKKKWWQFWIYLRHDQGLRPGSSPP